MDLQTIQSAETLKALCFDEIQKIEVAQNNLRLIQQRLAQVQKEELDALETKETAETTE